MGEEARLAAWHEVQAVVVGVDRVPVPVSAELLERHEAHEHGNVDERFERGPALHHVALAARSRECAHVTAVARTLAAVELERRVDVLAEPAVVEVALAVGEPAREEALVEALLQHVQAHVALVDAHACVRDAHRRIAGGAEDLGAQPIRDEARILHRIVEVELLEPVKERRAFELVELDGQCRAVVEVAVAARCALELDAATRREALAVDPQLERRIGARGIAQRLLGLGREHESQLVDLALFEVRVAAVLRRLLSVRRECEREREAECQRPARHAALRKASCTRSTRRRSRRRPTRARARSQGWACGTPCPWCPRGPATRRA